MISWFCIAVLLIHLLLLALVIVMLLSESSMRLVDTGKLPFVSVLLAARNESSNIIPCLESLAALDYRFECFEVLIGDDASEDDTAIKVAGFCKGRENFSLTMITSSVGKARGKANVLAQLAEKAKGDYLFITDADMLVPPAWLKAMLTHFEKNTGIVSGATIVNSNSFFSRLQRMEWTHLMGLFHVISTIYPVTAMGNNMAVRTRAYKATGGYENLPASVTEDYLLLKEVVKKGYEHCQALEPDCTCYTAPMKDLRSILNQRRRWLRGGAGQPWYILALLGIYSGFSLLILILFFLEPQVAGFLLACKISAEIVFYLITAGKVGSRSYPLLLLPFLFYLLLLNIGSMVAALWPGRVVWKGREYDA